MIASVDSSVLLRLVLRQSALMSVLLTGEVRVRMDEESAARSHSAIFVIQPDLAGRKLE